MTVVLRARWVVTPEDAVDEDAADARAVLAERWLSLLPAAVAAGVDRTEFFD